MYLPGSGGAQIHDLNPSQFPPVGLFWTVPIPAGGVQVDLDNGNALMRALKVPIFDYGTLQNATSIGSNPPPVPGWVSFKVVWTGGVASMPVNSTDPTKGIFSGTFAEASAQMEWQAAAGDFTFQSDPLETSQRYVCGDRSGNQRLLPDRVGPLSSDLTAGRLAGQQSTICRRPVPLAKRSVFRSAQYRLLDKTKLSAAASPSHLGSSLNEDAVARHQCTRHDAQLQPDARPCYPLQKAAGRLEWTVGAVFHDEGISGTGGRDERPGLDASLRD